MIVLLPSEAGKAFPGLSHLSALVYLSATMLVYLACTSRGPRVYLAAIQA